MRTCCTTQTLLTLVFLAAVGLTSGCYGDIPDVEVVDDGLDQGGVDDGATDDGATNDGATDDAADPAATGPPQAGGADYFVGGGFLLEESHANVLRKFSFLTPTEDGRAEGFNLDGRVSDEGDEHSCGHGDLLGIDGEEGIDNQLAEVWSLVGPLVGLQVEELLQGAINEGRVLLMLELVGADNLQNATGVTLNLFQGILEPDVGGLGVISPDQTFWFDYEGPASTVTDVEIIDGEVHAGPVYFELPIDILDAYFILKVRDGRVRFRIEEDGTVHGVIGGAFSVAEILEDLYETNAAEEAYLVTPIFEDFADLGPPNSDGLCDFFSVGIGFEGTNAWVVRDPELEPTESSPTSE